MARRTPRALTLLLLASAWAMTGCTADPPPPVLAPASSVTSPSETSPSAVPSPTASAGSGSPSAAPTSGSSAEPSPTPTPSTPATPVPGPRIVIDPGHSGRSIRSTDKATGLRDIDYPNYPEIYEAFDVSTCVARGLRADGYRVTLTKEHALDSVGLAARARIAGSARAALAISVHDDHSQGAGFEATYSQRGIKHGGAYHPMFRGTGSHRTVYSHSKAARASDKAAAVIARERSTAQGRAVTVRENTFTGRPPLEPGNLALVQLLSAVPWVYNEMGAKTAGSTTRAMSIASETGYAKGLLLGVEAAVPLERGRVAQPSRGAQQLRSCLVGQVQAGEGQSSRPTRYLPYGS